MEYRRVLIVFNVLLILIETLHLIVREELLTLIEIPRSDLSNSVTNTVTETFVTCVTNTLNYFFTFSTFICQGLYEVRYFICNVCRSCPELVLS